MLRNSARLLACRAVFSRPNYLKSAEKLNSTTFFRLNAVDYVNTNQILIKQLFSTSESALAKKKGENGTVKSKRKRIISASSSSGEDGDKLDGVRKKSRSE